MDTFLTEKNEGSPRSDFQQTDEAITIPGLQDSPQSDSEQASGGITIPELIPEETALMARSLTEYFQWQRMAYEMVSSHCKQRDHFFYMFSNFTCIAWVRI